MPDLVWLCCPKCGGSDLTRIGQVGNLYIRNKDLKLGVRESHTVKCNFCGSIFQSAEPTRMEAFGRDTVNNTSF